VACAPARGPSIAAHANSASGASYADRRPSHRARTEVAVTCTPSSPETRSLAAPRTSLPSSTQCEPARPMTPTNSLIRCPSRPTE